MSAERLQKVLASMGMGSRRQCESLVAGGRVSVNGVVARLGQRADPEQDVIEVNGNRIDVRLNRRYIALNKPIGCVTSVRSTHGERTVMEFLPESTGVFPVGRLDRDTSGLLLFTNDGEWANVVTHPRYEVEKEYEVVVKGLVSTEALERLRHGTRLPDGSVTSPAGVWVAEAMFEESRLFVTVIEGKKRQIRHMAAAVGNPVRRLRRIRIGCICLGDLPEGCRRELRAEEVNGIRECGSRIAAGSTETRAAHRYRRPGGSR